MQKRAVQFTKKPYLPLFSSETADKFAKDHAKLPLCPAPCDSAPPPPESSCTRSLYQRFLVSEIKYAFPYTFRTAHTRVSRNLNALITGTSSMADYTYLPLVAHSVQVLPANPGPFNTGHAPLHVHTANNTLTASPVNWELYCI